MRRAPVAAVVAASLLVPIVAIAASRGDGERTPAAAPSFQRDVAPILREKCTGCHQMGGIAPFSLETAKQAQKWSDAIAGAVKAKIMPPWPPGPASPDYVGQETRQLTAQQRSTILGWAQEGGKASGGGAGKAPPAKTEVRSGERSLTLAMPSSYTPAAKAGATDDYRCFLLDPRLTRGRAATRRDRSRSAVDRPPRDPLPRFKRSPGRKRSARRGVTRYGLVVLRRDRRLRREQDQLDDASWISAWAPGWGAGRFPDGTGVALPKGSLVVMQVHYNLLNGHAPDRSRGGSRSRRRPA